MPGFQALAGAAQRQHAADRFHRAAREFDPDMLHAKFRAVLMRAIASGHGIA
jgi:hypothetical protein